MIDGYVYAEIRNMLTEADIDVFGTNVISRTVGEKDFNKYSQALYPLLKNYFGEALSLDMSTSRGMSNALAKLQVDKDSNDKDYIELSGKYSSLCEEVLFYKSIIKKLLEVTK